MKKFALAAILGALAAAPAAQADIIDYAEIYGGYTQLPDLEQSPPVATFSFDAGYNLGATFGWNLLPKVPQLAFEFDMTYQSSEYQAFADYHLETFSAMINAVYTFDLGWKCSPYVGLGVGAISVTLDRPVDADSDIVMGYQGMVGIKTNLSGNIDGFVEYRYQGAGGDASVFVVDQEYQSHNASVGIRINL